VAANSLPDPSERGAFSLDLGLNMLGAVGTDKANHMVENSMFLQSELLIASDIIAIILETTVAYFAGFLSDILS